MIENAMVATDFIQIVGISKANEMAKNKHCKVQTDMPLRQGILYLPSTNTLNSTELENLISKLFFNKEDEKHER